MRRSEGLHGGAALGGAGAVEHPGAPGLGQRVQAQDVELGAQVQGEAGHRGAQVVVGPLATARGGLSEGHVEGLEGGVDDRHGAGKIEVLVHGRPWNSVGRARARTCAAGASTEFAPPSSENS